MKKICQVAFCPHCGNEAPQHLLHEQVYLETYYSLTDSSTSEGPYSSFIVVCETCNHVLVYDNPGHSYSQEEFHLADLVYPPSGQLHKSVPRLIAQAYAEAWRIKLLAPNAFVVQIRRALEAMCEDRNAKKGTLYIRLKDLSERREIPPVLAEATDLLRLLGNQGAHGLDRPVHPLQAIAIDDFFRAVMEYVYVAPSKIVEFKDQWQASMGNNSDGGQG